MKQAYTQLGDVMVIWGAFLLVVYLLIACMYTFLKRKQEIRGRFSFDQFYILVMVYITVMIGYGLIYFLLSQQGIAVLEEGHFKGTSQLDQLGHAVYFSGITLMTVGYGDISPIGIGKYIALSEALLGYVLPSAFFVRVLNDANLRRGRMR